MANPIRVTARDGTRTVHLRGAVVRLRRGEVIIDAREFRDRLQRRWLREDVADVRIDDDVLGTRRVVLVMKDGTTALISEGVSDEELYKEWRVLRLLLGMAVPQFETLDAPGQPVRVESARDAGQRVVAPGMDRIEFVVSDQELRYTHSFQGFSIERASWPRDQVFGARAFEEAGNGRGEMRRGIRIALTDGTEKEIAKRYGDIQKLEEIVSTMLEQMQLPTREDRARHWLASVGAAPEAAPIDGVLPYATEMSDGPACVRTPGRLRVFVPAIGWSRFLGNSAVIVVGSAIALLVGTMVSGVVRNPWNGAAAIAPFTLIGMLIVVGATLVATYHATHRAKVEIDPDVVTIAKKTLLSKSVEQFSADQVSDVRARGKSISLHAQQRPIWLGFARSDEQAKQIVMEIRRGLGLSP